MNTRTLAPSVDDAFALIVRDIVTAAFPHPTPNDPDPNVTIENVVDRITDAYIARMNEARRLLERSDRETRTLVARDQAKELLLLQLRSTITMLAESSGRALANSVDRTIRYDGVRDLVARAQEEDRPAVLLADLEEAMGGQLFGLPMMSPTVVGLAPESRFHTCGAFVGDPAAPRTHYAFVGWAIVLRSILHDSAVEPAFLVDGTVVPQSVLYGRGLTLERLI